MTTCPTTRSKPSSEAGSNVRPIALDLDESLTRLGRAELERSLDAFCLSANDAQFAPPEDDWLIWLFLGGRGAGKTRAGAEWVRLQVEAGVRRIALVGPTFNDVREVMIEGPSGLMAVGPAEDRPRYEATRKRLVWACGAVAYAFSAEDPDGLRGPQFERAWGDEFAAWAKPQATLDMLRMGLRLGDQPRLMLSTTPRPIPALKALVKAKGVVTTHQPTEANAANLAPGFLAAMQAAYGGSTLGRQEIEGLLIDDPPGALWTRTQVEGARCERVPELDRIVVAVDPPATGGPRSDECGIVVAGACGEGVQRRGTVRAVVLAQFYGVSCVRHTVVLRLRAKQKRWSEAVMGSRTATARALRDQAGERAAVAARPRVGASCAVGGV